MLDRDVVDAVRSMDEHELRRLLMLAQAQLERHGVELAAMRQMKLRRQMVRCGKDNCTPLPPRSVLVCILA